MAESAVGDAKSSEGSGDAPRSVAALDGTLLIRDMGGWNRKLAPLLLAGAAIGGRKEILPTIDGTTAATWL